jgi:hypothetical protein
MNNTCPKCGGNKVETIGKGRFFFATFFTGSFLMMISLIIWPLFIIAIPTFLASFACLGMKKVNKCHECKKIFPWVKESVNA